MSPAVPGTVDLESGGWRAVAVAFVPVLRGCRGFCLASKRGKLAVFAVTEDGSWGRRVQDAGTLERSMPIKNWATLAEAHVTICVDADPEVRLDSQIGEL